MSEDQVTFGGGAKAWCIICIVFSVPALFTNLAQGNILMAVGGALGVAGFIWLLVKKVRAAFYLILAAAILALIINIVVYGINPIFSLIGLLNPLLTYLFIKGYWSQMK